MKDCIVCKHEGVIHCVETSLASEEFTKKQLLEILEDIIETKQRGGKL